MNSQETHPLIVFAGGGTGGHLYPLVSVAVEIGRRIPAARLVFLTTDRPIDRRVIECEMSCESTPFDIAEQCVRPLPRSLRSLPGFLLAWRRSVNACLRRFRHDAPRIVIGSGGFGCGPPVVAARKLGIPTVLLNPDALPGRANRFLGRRADCVFVQWSIARDAFTKGTRVVVAGCPVRSAIGQTSRQRGMAAFGLDPTLKTLLITGASQGARSINHAIVASLERLAAVGGWQFLHVTGGADEDSVRLAYRRRGVRSSVVRYTDEMPAALAAADLVVSRAGASTLAELTAVGVASVLMPYPHHRDRHQYANAAVLVDAGAAVLVEDKLTVERNAKRLADGLVAIMGDSTRLDVMRQNAAKIGDKGAAATIADRVLSLAGLDDCDCRGGHRTASADLQEWSDQEARDDDEHGRVGVVSQSQNVLSETRP